VGCSAGVRGEEAFMVAAVAKKKLERLELRAEADWVKRLAAEAERLGVSVSAYLRMAASEKMDRAERERERKED
jgi:hypothetical protein